MKMLRTWTGTACSGLGRQLGFRTTNRRAAAERVSAAPKQAIKAVTHVCAGYSDHIAG